MDKKQDVQGNVVKSLRLQKCSESKKAENEEIRLRSTEDDQTAHVETAETIPNPSADSGQVLKTIEHLNERKQTKSDHVGNDLPVTSMTFNSLRSADSEDPVADIKFILGQYKSKILSQQTGEPVASCYSFKSKEIDDTPPHPRYQLDTSGMEHFWPDKKKESQFKRSGFLGIRSRLSSFKKQSKPKISNNDVAVNSALDG